MTAAGADGLGRRGSLTPLGGGFSEGGSGGGGGGSCKGRGRGVASEYAFDGLRRLRGGNSARFSRLRSRRRLFARFAPMRARVPAKRRRVPARS